MFFLAFHIIKMESEFLLLNTIALDSLIFHKESMNSLIFKQLLYMLLHESPIFSTLHKRFYYQ